MEGVDEGVDVDDIEDEERDKLGVVDEEDDEEDMEDNERARFGVVAGVGAVDVRVRFLGEG